MKLKRLSITTLRDNVLTLTIVRSGSETIFNHCVSTVYCVVQFVNVEIHSLQGFLEDTQGL